MEAKAAGSERNGRRRWSLVAGVVRILELGEVAGLLSGLVEEDSTGCEFLRKAVERRISRVVRGLRLREESWAALEEAEDRDSRHWKVLGFLMVVWEHHEQISQRLRAEGAL